MPHLVLHKLSFLELVEKAHAALDTNALVASQRAHGFAGDVCRAVIGGPAGCTPPIPAIPALSVKGLNPCESSHEFGGKRKEGPASQRRCGHVGTRQKGCAHVRRRERGKGDFDALGIRQLSKPGAGYICSDKSRAVLYVQVKLQEGTPR